MRQASDAALRELSLTTPQYAALSAVEKPPGLSGAALARRSFVTPQTMNNIVALLLYAGMVERRAHPANKRVLQLYLTPSGAQAVQQAHQRIRRVEAQMLAGLAEAEQQQLAAWLRACSAALEQGE